MHVTSLCRLPACLRVRAQLDNRATLTYDKASPMDNIKIKVVESGSGDDYGRVDVAVGDVVEAADVNAFRVDSGEPLRACVCVCVCQAGWGGGQGTALRGPGVKESLEALEV